MLIISSREFREKQKSYLDKVDQGMDILIQRGKNKAYKIVSITGNDTLMSKEDYFAKIDRALEGIKKGKGKTITGKDELAAYLESL